MTYNSAITIYSPLKGVFQNSIISIKSRVGIVVGSILVIGSKKANTYNSIMNIEGITGTLVSSTYNSIAVLKRGLYHVLPVNLSVFEQIFIAAHANIVDLSGETAELPFSKVGGV